MSNIDISLSLLLPSDWNCPICSDTNPRGESDSMVLCDSCSKWFHYCCVNLVCAPPEDEKWFCPTCTPTKNKKRPKHPKSSSKTSKSNKSDKKESKKSTSDWLCLTCNKSTSTAKPTICCDGCDQWYHWHCVGIIVPPKDDDSWYCDSCSKS